MSDFPAPSHGAGSIKKPSSLHELLLLKFPELFKKLFPFFLPMSADEELPFSAPEDSEEGISRPPSAAFFRFSRFTVSCFPASFLPPSRNAGRTQARYEKHDSRGIRDTSFLRMAKMRGRVSALRPSPQSMIRGSMIGAYLSPTRLNSGILLPDSVNSHEYAAWEPCVRYPGRDCPQALPGPSRFRT